MAALLARRQPVAAVDPAAMQERLADAVITRIGPNRYEAWLAKQAKFVLLGDRVVVGVPNHFCQDWIQKQFGEAIKAAADEVFGAPTAVSFAIDPELFRAARAEQEELRNADCGTRNENAIPAAKPAPAPKLKAAAADAIPIRTPQPEFRDSPGSRNPKRRWKSLGDFVVGACNRVAHASACSVVEEPGQGANPLVLYGPTGTGKTHLLEGIYVGLRRGYSDAKVTFVTAEDFVNRFVSAMHQNKQPTFRKQFREAFALLIDDLTFLASKKQTQIEFLHTFDALIADGCQVVVTCDSHPRLCDDLMPELVDRLLGGAVWSLLPPDAETRLALLKSKSAEGSPGIPEGVLKYLATNLRGNVRELEGAVASVRHFARVTGRLIDEVLAREALGELLRHAVRVVGIADVDAAVCAVLRLPAGTLKSKARAYAVSHPRMLAVYLGRKHTAATYGEIAAFYGNKTHSTAVAAEKKVRQWVGGNETVKAGERMWNVRELVERIEGELRK